MKILKRPAALLTALALCAALTGCMRTNTNAGGTPTSTPAGTAGPAATGMPEQTMPDQVPAQSGMADSTPAADPMLSDALRAALEGGYGYESGSAGGSLRTAQAAAALVQVIAENGVPDQLDTLTDQWRASLTEEQRTVLMANWPGISERARAIAADPAGQKALLGDAGVTTDFTTLDLTRVTEAFDVLDRTFTGKS